MDTDTLLFSLVYCLWTRWIRCFEAEQTTRIQWTEILRLNVSHNCIHPHVQVIWEGENARPSNLNNMDT